MSFPPFPKNSQDPGSQAVILTGDWKEKHCCTRKEQRSSRYFQQSFPRTVSWRYHHQLLTAANIQCNCKLTWLPGMVPLPVTLHFGEHPVPRDPRNPRPQAPSPRAPQTPAPARDPCGSRAREASRAARAPTFRNGVAHEEVGAGRQRVHRRRVHLGDVGLRLPRPVIHGVQRQHRHVVLVPPTRLRDEEQNHFLTSCRRSGLAANAESRARSRPQPRKPPRAVGRVPEQMELTAVPA